MILAMQLASMISLVEAAWLERPGTLHPEGAGIAEDDE